MEERILYEEHVPFKICYFGSLFNLVSTVLWGAGILIAYLQSRAEKVKITTERISITHGILSKQFEEIELVRVKDISLKQNIRGTLFNFGYLTIISTDSSTPKIVLPMQKPQDWREQIRTAVRQEKDRLGVQYGERLN